MFLEKYLFTRRRNRISVYWRDVLDSLKLSKKQLIEEIKTLKVNKEYEKAESLITQAITQFTQQPIFYFHLAQVYNATDRCDAAITLLNDAIKSWPKNKNIRKLAAVSYSNAGAYNNALAVLAPLPDIEIDFPIALIKAKSFLYLDKLDAAFDVIKKFKPPWPGSSLVFLVELVLKVGCSQGTEKAKDLVNEIEKNISNIQRFRGLLTKELVKSTRGLELDRENKSIVPIAKFLLSHIDQLDPQDVVPLSEFFLSVSEYGQVDEILHKHPDLGSDDLNKKREWILLLSSSAENESSLPGENRLRADEVLLDNSLYHFRNSKERCFIWFAGTVLANSMSFLTTLIPLLKSRGISCLVVVDKKRYMSLGGFGPFFPDRIRAREALEEIVNLLGYRELATSAHSGSGLSALLYGTELRARGILGFNALTKMPEDVPGMNPLALKHKNKLFKNITVTPQDSYELVKNTPNSKVFLCFSEEFSFDRDNAHHLSSLAHVNLWPKKCDYHNLLGWLQTEDQLQDTFEKFLDNIGWKSYIS